jgi:hypothetical protein
MNLSQIKKTGCVVFVLATQAGADDPVINISRVERPFVALSLRIPADALRARVTGSHDLQSWQLTQALPTGEGEPWLEQPAGGWRSGMEVFLRDEQEYSFFRLEIERENLNAWQLTTVDNTATVGLFTSLAFDPEGNPAISYNDSSSGDLKYAVYDGAGWVVSLVDSEGDVGSHSSLAFAPNGQPAISYYEGDPQNDLKYAWYDGSTWRNMRLDQQGDVGTYTSLAFGGGGRPHISYFDVTNGALKYAMHDGFGWLATTVDTAQGDGQTGLFTSLALRADGRPSISYYATNELMNNGVLRYAEFDWIKWNIATVEGGGSNSHIGTYTSLAFDADDRPSISYLEGGHYNLQYAVNDDSGWTSTTVDSDGFTGLYTSLAFDAGGRPAISYYDFINDTLKYSCYDGSKWIALTVDSTARVGIYTSLAFAPNGHPAISYFDITNSALKFAIRRGLK